MTTPKPILQVVADTPIGQQTADSLIQELRAKGYTVSGSAGDVLVAVIAPGTNPLQLVQAAHAASTPILVVAVGALPPHFAGSEYSAVEPVRHDGAIPGRTRELVEDALDDIAALKKSPPKSVNPGETPILEARPIVPPPTSEPIIPHDSSVKTTPKEPRTKSLLEQLIFPLIVTVVGTVIAAYVLGQVGGGGTPTPTNTPTPTATLPLPTDTHTPTDSPTDAPTLEPSATDAPPTNAPPSATDTPEPSPATNTAETAVVVGGGVEIQLFITDDTLAIYSAESSEIIPQLRITDADGEIHALADYSALGGIPFDFVNPPLCVVLRLSNADSPFPQICQNLPNRNNLFRHPLTQADVFWYDAVQGERALTVLLGDTPAGYCPAGQAECTVTLPGQ